MFMLSFRLRRLPLLIGCLALAAVLVAGTVGVKNFGLAQTETKVAAEKKPGAKRSTAAKSNEDRLAYLSSYGWELEQEPLEILEVVVPKEFDEIYEAYNAMQKAQGHDLSDYAGKRCKRYAYRILNYPGTEEPVRAHLLVYKNKVIGGDVCSERQGGFMHGFELK